MAASSSDKNSDPSSKRESPARKSHGKSKGKSQSAPGTHRAPINTETKTKLRIIGGGMRGRTIVFRIDPTTRPMKDRTREALFNLLGGKLEGYVTFDLFAGSGILSFESISRGAEMAVAIELDRTACKELIGSASQLGVTQFLARQGDAFYYSESIKSWTSDWSSQPWCIFICPPYRIWKTQPDNCKRMIAQWCQLAPEGSLIAIEFEEPAPVEFLPEEWEWDIRTYRPAVLAIGCPPAAS